MEGFQNVAVTRQDNQLMIHWQGENLGEVKVYQSATPDFTESTGWLVGSTEQSSYTRHCSHRNGHIFYWWRRTAHASEWQSGLFPWTVW